MRVFEPGWIFKAIAEQPVEEDMRSPDESDGEQNRTVRGISGQEENQRADEEVAQVVNRGADAWTNQVAEHKQVWRKKEHCEEQPAEVKVDIDEDGGGEQGSFFDAEQQGRASEHIGVPRSGDGG
jgi:hypothetical protein